MTQLYDFCHEHLVIPNGSNRHDLPAILAHIKATKIAYCFLLMYACIISTHVYHDIVFVYICNGYRIWIINKHFRNSEHHLLSSMSSGEHPLRVGTLTRHSIILQHITL